MGQEISSLKVSEIPIETVLRHYNIIDKLQSSGQRLVGPCPLHEGAGLQVFLVNPRENTWVCNGECKTRGSVIDFIQLKEGLGRRKAVRLMSDLCRQA